MSGHPLIDPAPAEEVIVLLDAYTFGAFQRWLHNVGMHVTAINSAHYPPVYGTGVCWLNHPKEGAA